MLDQARDHWPYLAGAALLLIAVVLTWRAVRRIALAREDAELAAQGDADAKARIEVRTRAKERRGRIIEDWLTAAVAAAAAGMSATQLIKFAEDVVDLHGLWRILPFAGLDVAAIVCALRARRRARRGLSAGLSGVLVWLLAFASASFSAGEAHSLWQAIGRGIWALVAAVLWEIGLAEERYASAPRVDRRLGWIRWLHPRERVLVLAELASDETISADEATQRVRERRAAQALLKLRRSAEAQGAAEWDERKDRRSERAAQRAVTRVRMADPEISTSVLKQLQVLDEVRRIATTNWDQLRQPLVQPTVDQPVLSHGPAAGSGGPVPGTRAVEPAVPVQGTSRTSTVVVGPVPPEPKASPASKVPAREEAGPAVPPPVNEISAVEVPAASAASVSMPAPRPTFEENGFAGSTTDPMGQTGESGRTLLTSLYWALSDEERALSSRKVAEILAPRAGLAPTTAKKYIIELARPTNQENRRPEEQPTGDNLPTGGSGWTAADDDAYTDYDAAGEPVTVRPN